MIPRELAIELARLAADTRCSSVVLLDVGNISPVTDYLILATGTSPRQMRTVANDCVELAEEKGFKAFSVSGLDSSNWICVDLVDMVLHVFSEEARLFYDLESLWADAVKIDWQAAIATGGQ